MYTFFYFEKMQVSMFLVIASVAYFAVTQGSTIPVPGSQSNQSRCNDSEKLFKRFNLVVRMNEALSGFSRATYKVRYVNSSTDPDLEQFKLEIENNCTDNWSSLRNDVNEWFQAREDCGQEVPSDFGEARILFFDTILWRIDYICNNQGKVLESVLDGGVECRFRKSEILSQCPAIHLGNPLLKRCQSASDMFEHYSCKHKALKQCPASTVAEMAHHLKRKLSEIPSCQVPTNVI